MKYLLILLPLLLTGCFKTVPVARHFPDVPEELRQDCGTLQQTPDTRQLSEVIRTVSGNYSRYHECRARNEAWREWYDAQKKIFEEVK